MMCVHAIIALSSRPDRRCWITPATLQSLLFCDHPQLRGGGAGFRIYGQSGHIDPLVKQEIFRSELFPHRSHEHPVGLLQNHIDEQDDPPSWTSSDNMFLGCHKENRLAFSEVNSDSLCLFVVIDSEADEVVFSIK